MKKAGAGKTLTPVQAPRMRPTGVAQKSAEEVKGADAVGMPPLVSGDDVASMMVQDAKQAVSSRGKVDRRAVMQMLRRASMQDAATEPGADIKPSDVAAMIRRAKATKPGEQPNEACASALSHVKSSFAGQIDDDAKKLIAQLEEAHAIAVDGGTIPSALVSDIKASVADGSPTDRAIVTAFVRQQYASSLSASDLSSLDSSLTSLSNVLFQAQMEASMRQSEQLAEESRRSLEAAKESDQAAQELQEIARGHKAGMQFEIRAENFEIGIDHKELKDERLDVHVDTSEVKEERFEKQVGFEEVKEVRAERFFDAEDVAEQDFGKGLDDAAGAKAANQAARVKGDTAFDANDSPWVAAMLSVKFPGAKSI